MLIRQKVLLNCITIASPYVTTNRDSVNVTFFYFYMYMKVSWHQYIPIYSLSWNLFASQVKDVLQRVAIWAIFKPIYKFISVDTVWIRHCTSVDILEYLHNLSTPLKQGLIIDISEGWKEWSLVGREVTAITQTGWFKMPLCVFDNSSECVGQDPVDCTGN